MLFGFLSVKRGSMR